MMGWGMVLEAVPQWIPSPPGGTTGAILFPLDGNGSPSRFLILLLGLPSANRNFLSACTNIICNDNARGCRKLLVRSSCAPSSQP
jgi:hypothetical protein